MTNVAEGCLLVADIGGYTRYLGGVELEHSHDILADLIGLVADRLGGALTVAKLEGDAVFCRGGEPGPDGDELVSLIEACYFAFARRQRTIGVQTSCPCDACRRIPDLDLKFVAHFGSFVEHAVAGSRELTGPAVILVHRLLKNSVLEKTGTQAYALVTDSCIRRLDMQVRTEGWRAHTETYDDVGDVAAHVLDLEERWREEQERRVAFVIAEEADVTLEAELPVPPEEVWHAMTDARMQERWRVGATRIDQENPHGAPGVGTVTHCVHGKQTIDQEILDWKPFHYYSYSERNPIGDCIWTVELTPLDGDGGQAERTRLAWRIQLTGGTAQRIAYALFGRRLRRVLRANLDAFVRMVGSGPSVRGTLDS